MCFTWTSTYNAPANENNSQIIIWTAFSFKRPGVVTVSLRFLIKKENIKVGKMVNEDMDGAKYKETVEGNMLVIKVQTGGSPSASMSATP